VTSGELLVLGIASAMQAEARGIEKGVEKGIKKGKAEGMTLAVEQMRQMVLRSIEQRFGTVPERVLARVQTIKGFEPLGNMLKRLPLVESADDLLPRRGRPRS
jgi:flagellar biosynthesis/type III secretory pathway protein FliH